MSSESPIKNATFSTAGNILAIENLLPDPPYPASTSSAGWRFELDMQKITQSSTWALAGAYGRPWLLMLWTTAWSQLPCGSLPANEEVIAALIGMDSEQWAKRRKVLLRGWRPCSDGRLYHDVIVDRVKSMLASRNNERDRKAAYREAKKNKNNDLAKMSHGTTMGQPRDSHGNPALEQELEQEQVIKSPYGLSAPAEPSPPVHAAPEPSPAPPPSASAHQAGFQQSSDGWNGNQGDVAQHAQHAQHPDGKTNEEGGDGPLDGKDAFGACPHLELLDLFAKTLPELAQPRYELWAGSTGAKHLKARWSWLKTAKSRSGKPYVKTRQEAIDWLGRFFSYVGKSDFLMGREKSGWSANLHWLVKAENFAKVVDGAYHKE